ncbi:sugar ABC transporter ATP-binding protein [Breznakiella homolactica]|uniref:Sugar ABC transporter ATP-binding protein n=1 Tax=Breznakiella homolactica TaxID=2798577 RepID=A0A7T7XPS1_9SPIR|nr:sugar ABC transporter ATP-binding protein [Breznakiella homolactica]QQO10147.1 sugar ABC transporter ATP-binding protein [Breznakiella homolactica]
MSEYSIEAEGLNISFNGVQVLHNVDFRVKEGEVHALVGTNGAGKSTLVKIINGVYKRDSGTIAIHGKPVNYENPEGALEAGIAMVFQDLSLIPSMTVAENIFLKTNPYRKGPLIDDRENSRRARELLELIGVDAEIRPQDLVEDMSIGQQQLVEIAKALSNNPSILILDEPTASLSNTEIERLFTVIETLKSKGISIIYITHYLQDIFKICDAITLIRDGRIIFRKETNEIDMNFLIDSMTGSESEAVQWIRKQDLRKGTPLLEIKNLSTAKVTGISLSIYPGEIVGVAGLLGSGRTELLKALFGIDKIISGDIFINGEKVSIPSTTEAISHGIALIPENRREQGLVLDFPVGENMVLSIFNRLRKFLMIDDKKRNDLANHYIKTLNVKTRGPNQIVRYLSGGNQQKVVVAKSLASDSKILLLDDPTFGVDVHAKREIMKIIHDYAAQGNGVLMVSSEFNEIVDFCDSIYVMKKGQVTDFLADHISEDDLLYKVQ